MSEKYAIQTLLSAPQTMGTVAHAIIKRAFGKEAYDWDIVTILMEAKDEFGADMDADVANRWAAIQTAVTTDAYFDRLDSFLAINNTLAGGEPYFTTFDPVTTEEIAWGLSEMSLNRPLKPFAYAIRKYVKTVLEQDGYKGDYPDIFDFILGGKDEVKKELRRIHANPNNEAIDLYVKDQMEDLAFQLNQVPSIADLKDILEDNETLIEEK